MKLIALANFTHESIWRIFISLSKNLLTNFFYAFLGKCNNFLTTCQCFGFWLQASRGPCKSCLFYCPVINWNHSGSTLVIFYLDGWSKWRRSLWYRKLYIGDIHHFLNVKREGGFGQLLPPFKNSIRNYIALKNYPKALRI